MNDVTTARLSALADIGYLIVPNIRAEQPEILTDGGLRDLSSEALLAARDAEDCIIQWLDSSVGVELLSTIRVNSGDTTDPDFLSAHENGTAFSMLHDGAKVVMILLHTAKDLSEQDTRAAKSLLFLMVNEQPAAEIPTLGPRELAYLKKVSEGATDEEIAEEFNLSMRSVKERKKRTITDLGATNISLAIYLAKKSGQL